MSAGEVGASPFSPPKGHRNDLIFEANDVVSASDYVPYALCDGVLQAGGCRNRRAVGAAP